MWDEEERGPESKGRFVIGCDLETHSVEALQGFVEELRCEIERIEAAIRRKGSDRQAAERFFRK